MPLLGFGTWQISDAEAPAATAAALEAGYRHRHGDGLRETKRASTRRSGLPGRAAHSLPSDLGYRRPTRYLRLVRRMIRWRIGGRWWLIVPTGLPTLTMALTLLLPDRLTAVDVLPFAITQTPRVPR
jgi:hypothetical protein